MADAEQALGLESDVVSALEALLNKQEPAAPPAPEPEENPAVQPQEAAPEPEAEATDADDAEAAEPPQAEAEAEPVQAVSREVQAAAKPVTAKPEAAKAAPEPNDEDATLTQLNTLIPRLQAAISAEFHDIKTFEDLQRVAREDPARYNRYVLNTAQLQQAAGEQTRLAQAKQARWYQSEAQKLAEAIPEMADPVKGAALKAELRTYALAKGYTEQQIALASANDVSLLYENMQYAKWKAEQKAKPAAIAEAQAKAKEKAAKAPPVQKPGNVRADDANEKVRGVAQQFRKSGRLDDLATLLQETGIV